MVTNDFADQHCHRPSPPLTEQVRRPNCGAVVTFLGTVRDLTGDRVTVALDYEAYPGMAEKKMAEIEARHPRALAGRRHGDGASPRPSRGRRQSASRWPSAVRTAPRRSRRAAMPSIGSRNWCRSGRRKTGPTARRSGCIQVDRVSMGDNSMKAIIDQKRSTAEASDKYRAHIARLLRPRSQQPAHQRHRPLQPALHLLHGRGRGLHGPRRTADLRGDRPLRPRRGARWASTRFA